MNWRYPPYVSVAERRKRSEKTVSSLEKKGQKLSPVRIEGRKIATSFWGKAWCDNLESYSDYENRLPRGRSYVRNGSVLDLQIMSGVITSLVSGSSLYRVKIQIKPVTASAWAALKVECSGQVGSLFDLLQGKLSASVMQIMTRPETGLFPHPSEISLSCSCPDSAVMCKHVAATLYAVGARLDQTSELLFTLRGADHLELITAATESALADVSQETLSDENLADVFGIEIESSDPQPAKPAPRKKTPPKKAAAAKKTATKKKSAPVKTVVKRTKRKPHSLQ